ncbi:histidine kinase-, DNA gyrase B-, and HSP90-like ATPase [Terrimicrobium sacchariphilum]|uniref:histidine kinase n=1 Tax=Terrimicrobium sacchariphilum TaxID=690879 RepID=A0A146G699_TERSA|nr:HAMP domain-containing sensor histidine kinase [Terrimicrobium sacchariphilum]GAT32903.1 histidine kinase-, DNA gyrase B-, and HSP90-like ATPase [Terrimicrobium sacchariphilum]
MFRSALIFLVAIFLPSLVLGWLALRAAGEQNVLIERQAADLHQAQTDAIAADLRQAVEQQQGAFVEQVRQLVAAHGAEAVAENFGSRLGEGGWFGGIPFAISPGGALAYPSISQARQEAGMAAFLAGNSSFLSNAAPAEIYQLPQSAAPAAKNAQSKSLLSSVDWVASRSSKPKETPTQQAATRNISPQKGYESSDAAASSRIAPELSNFQTAIAGAPQGIMARFVQDELQVLFWTKPEARSEWVFGVMLTARQLQEMIAPAFDHLDPSGEHLAVLNDRSRPVLRLPGDFSAEWKHPFVATEIGEVLPHWEVALYLANPGALTKSARLVSITLVLLIMLALGAILAGAYFVSVDIRRQLAIAQKKTDFVSNVSHELKTPLTSIRMFAELLVEGKVTEPEKQSRYLRIIATESERLTRLVNNVLDFARMERKRKVYAMHAVDLHEIIARLWEVESTRLREAGFSVTWDAATGPYPVVCDADAITQVLVNLFSNAEKYAADGREITLATRLEPRDFIAEVKDRGPGIPRAEEEKIFEAFHRVDDSLTSGIQGSGLGLTLARRIICDHGGDLRVLPREGGGCVFTVRLPRKPFDHS